VVLEGAMVNFRRRILFCYISPSSGHQRAAEAVMSVLRRRFPSVACEAVNSVSYVNPLFGKIVSRLYLQILKAVPSVWDYLYDNPWIEKNTRDVREVLSLFNTKRIVKVLRTHKPRCLVCTQAVPVGLLAALKEKEKLRIPLIGILTDFGVHKYWLSPHVDLYLVPTVEVRRSMVRMGVDESRVRVTGIPVDPHFSSPGDSRMERLSLGLSPTRPTVLVMGGSYGMGPLAEAMVSLRRMPLSPQLIVVCGNNRRLYKDMTQRFFEDRSVRVFGPTRTIHRLMTAADVLVSKPGGLTMSEALVRGLPVVIVEPIPGQEERNAHFLLRQGTCVRAHRLTDLTREVEMLLTHPDLLKQLKEKAQAIARPLAAQDAADAIVDFIEKGGSRETGF